ncbi:MAG: hypothetical protein PVF57_09180 [Pseudomonadales bacterium]
MAREPGKEKVVMKVLALPGRNPETESWMQALVDGLSVGHTGARVAHYRHWDSGGDPDVAGEADRVEAGPEDLVIGKSLGTLVLLTVAGRQGNPGAAVFIGTPLVAYEEERLQRLRDFADATPSLFIQQTGDVTGSFAELASALQAPGRATLVEVPGSDHVYADTTALVRIIGGWWSALDRG